MENPWLSRAARRRAAAASLLPPPRPAPGPAPPPDFAGGTDGVLAAAYASACRWRSHPAADVASFFGDLPLVGGLVTDVRRWLLLADSEDREAVVLGGVSLFGGRGSVWAALLGALVIGSISNGMDLLAFESSVKFIVTGAVLAGAVILDALARKRRLSQGRS